MEPDEIEQRDELIRTWAVQSTLSELKSDISALTRTIRSLREGNNILANNRILQQEQIDSLRAENDSIRRVLDEILRLTERIANGESEENSNVIDDYNAIEDEDIPF